jgi:hypothetical protein
LELANRKHGRYIPHETHSRFSEAATTELDIQNHRHRATKKKKQRTHLLDKHIPDLHHIPNTELGSSTSRAAFRSTIDEPRTDITVLIKQTHGELMQFLAFIVRNIRKSSMFLNRMRPRIFRQSTVTSSRRTQYGVELFYAFWVIKVFSVVNFGVHSVRLSDVAIFLVVVGGFHFDYVIPSKSTTKYRQPIVPVAILSNGTTAYCTLNVFPIFMGH